jgi:carboxypeptidase Taq
MQDDLGDLDELLEQGEFTPLREWLGEHIHRHGRKYPPQELLEKAIGSTIDAKPYIAYLKRKFGVAVAA